MSDEELKELSLLIEEFRATADKDTFYRASDFDILKAFTQCAIDNAKDITRKDNIQCVTPVRVCS